MKSRGRENRPSSSHRRATTWFVIALRMSNRCRRTGPEPALPIPKHLERSQHATASVSTSKPCGALCAGRPLHETAELLNFRSWPWPSSAFEIGLLWCCHRPSKHVCTRGHRNRLERPVAPRRAKDILCIRHVAHDHHTSRPTLFKKKRFLTRGWDLCHSLVVVLQRETKPWKRTRNPQKHFALQFNYRSDNADGTVDSLSASHIDPSTFLAQKMLRRKGGRRTVTLVNCSQRTNMCSHPPHQNFATPDVGNMSLTSVIVKTTTPTSRKPSQLQTVVHIHTPFGTQRCFNTC